MYNLDAIGLILVFSILILGGGYYLMNKKTRNNKSSSEEIFSEQPKKLVPATVTIPVPDREKDMETAEDLFPDFNFPPEPEKAYTPELPLGYGDNRLVIMARDPEWIYAYWDINEEKKHNLMHTYGVRWENSLPVLRVYDVTNIDYFNGHNANSFFDIVINENAGNWYIHVGQPNRKYCADLGRILNDGTYITIARSNLTMTPRNTLSDRIDPEWMMVSENEQKLYQRMGLFGGISSPELFKRKD